MKRYISSSVPVFAFAFGLLGSSWAGSFDWPQWRGPDRADVSKESGLLKEWPAGGPKRVWLFKNAGNGYSGPAIVNGKLFTMGTRDGAEILIALNANTGEELWTAPIGPMVKFDRGGGPRGTPTVDGDHIYALGGQGNLICAAVADGKAVWRVAMADLGGKTPNWGYAESVLVDADKVVCTPGGDKGAIAALDKTTGKVVWQSKEFTDPAHYASIIVAEHSGTREYIQLTPQHVVGVSATDGSVLWKSAFPGRVAVIPTPIFHDGCVYVTAGYGAGSKLVKLGADNQVSDVYENKEMKNHHGGVVLVGDDLYGYSDGVGWLCQDFKTGKEVWSEKKALGKGALGCADGMLYCLEEDSGTVVLAEASPKGWKAHGRFKLDPQSKIRDPQGRIWTHPVISNGKLYLRDQDIIYCYDVKKG
ncbi:MAG: polyvinylalcohol dehydrogenase [Verrucomicrobia bacterium]|nr:MAG: polyvinylalcohol dehydrogenase [Verrucomicrobiota bacterium]